MPPLPTWLMQVLDAVHVSTVLLLLSLQSELEVQATHLLPTQCPLWQSLSAEQPTPMLHFLLGVGTAAQMPPQSVPVSVLSLAPLLQKGCSEWHERGG